MNSLVAGWIDLTKKTTPSEIYRKLSGRCDIRYLKVSALIRDTVRELSPGLLCFEFDAPDPGKLQTLRLIRVAYPSLPVLLITEYHSEEFAVWALRMRVLDYFVMPVVPEQILEHIRMISNLSKNGPSRKINRENVPISPIPIEIRCSALKTEGRREGRTYHAVSYIETHYADKIREEDAASICGLKTNQFSILFKKEQEITFQSYLIRHRIYKAAERLKDPSEKVTHAASSVGFNDLSDFAIIFKRYFGILPSQYRRQGK